jgi:outer membrane protein
MKIRSVVGILAMTLIVAACGNKKKGEENTIANVQPRELGELRIAFYHSDSLKTNFDYYREQDSIVTKKQLAFQKEVERRTKEYQDYIVRNDEKARSGLLSQNEMMQIQQRIQQMEGELMRYQQEQGRKIEEETMSKLESISKKIEVLGKKFSEESKIDILLIHGAGGQLNFINPEMDVTKEFVAFLNKNQADIEKDLKK